jgi:transcriptional regulator with XRE-family HTH domain
MKTKNNLGRCLRAYRILNEKTIRELAKEIGLSAATAMRIEHGYAMDAANLLKVLNWMMRNSSER